METATFLGVELALVNYEALRETLEQSSRDHQGQVVDFANTHIVAHLRESAKFRALCRSVTIRVPDGMPLIWGLNAQGANLQDRVYGPTFMRYFLERARAGSRHAFIGGSQDCGRLLIEKIQSWNPGIQVTGRYHGRCTAEGELEGEDLELSAQLAQADFIWVGLGTPKQYAWIQRNVARFPRAIFLAVGFAFDVNAGTKSDAPLWMQNAGLTWLFRLASEPRRLFSRYAKYNSLFIAYWVLDSLRDRFFPRAEPSAETHVLIIVENLPVPFDRRVWQEALVLKDAGYAVSVICPKLRGFTQSEELLDGIAIHRHWISSEASGSLGYLFEYASALFGEARLACKVWRRRRFQIVHLCNPPDLLFLVALPFKMLFRVKVIYDVHDLWPEMFEAKFEKRGVLYWLVRTAERATLALADVVIATNETVRQAVLSRGKKSHVHVVRTAPKWTGDEGSVCPELRKGRQFLVGYVGVMGNADGIHLLLEAVAFLIFVKKRTDISFLLMGSGPEFANLQRLSEDLQITSYVEMPGRVSNEFLQDALRTMDIGVSCDPPNSYNHGCTMNKVLEYMVYGKSQVLFDLREGRESAGDAALYAVSPTAEGLGLAILDLLDQPALRQQMGAIARSRMQGALSWKHSSENLLAAYNS